MKAGRNQAASSAANEMSVAEIVHAPWNPRTEAEFKPDHPAMVELIESVKALGVVQPIAVWTGLAAAEIAGHGRSVCIAGNRRLEAAKVVGMKTIPIFQFTDLTVEEAQAITRAENECRFGVSPLLDAKLVKSMMDVGRSQSEIAALVGVSEATVCRRAKLLDLSPDVVKAVGDEKVDAKVLEMVAAYPDELQRKAAERIKNRLLCGGRITPTVVDSMFGELTRKIVKGLWIFQGERGRIRYESCLQCPSCTGNQRELFDLVDETHGESNGSEGTGEGKCLGRCLNVKCFKRYEAAAKKEAIAAAIDHTSGGAGADGIVNVANKWLEPYASMKAKKRGKGKTFAYVHWNEYEAGAEVKWGPDPVLKKKADAAAKAKRDKAIEEQQKNVRYAESALDAVREKLFGDAKSQDVDHCAKVVRAMPIDLVADLLADHLCYELFDTWGKRYSIALRLVRELPSFKSLLSAEEFAALESLGGEK